MWLYRWKEDLWRGWTCLGTSAKPQDGCLPVAFDLLTALGDSWSLWIKVADDAKLGRQCYVALSRYNTTTSELTSEMFRAVVAAIRDYLDSRSHAITSSAFLSGGNTG
jgi:hypothetical protein